MEKTSPNTFSTYLLLATFVGSLLFPGILNWVIRIHKFYSGFFLCFYQYSQLDFIFDKSKCQLEKKNSNSELLGQNFVTNNKGDDGKLSREDVEMVMEKLRFVSNPYGEKLQERLGLDEISVLFEDKEPSVEEVKVAFDLFDENKDGFVDARELQRVLCSLGFREGAEVETCKMMIRAFDVNGDERIDFNEFVKLMEKSFC